MWSIYDSTKAIQIKYHSYENNITHVFWSYHQSLSDLFFCWVIMILFFPADLIKSSTETYKSTENIFFRLAMDIFWYFYITCLERILHWLLEITTPLEIPFLLIHKTSITIQPKISWFVLYLAPSAKISQSSPFYMCIHIHSKLILSCLLFSHARNNIQNILNSLIADTTAKRLRERESRQN